MKIHEIAASWDREKALLRAALRLQTSQLVSKAWTQKSMGIHETVQNHMKTYEIQTNTAISWDRSKVSLRAAFRLQTPQLVSKPRTPEIHGNV